MIPLGLLVPKREIALAILVVITCMCLLFVSASALHGRVDKFLVVWALVFPLGYYFLTFPRDRAIFTLDRAMLGLLAVAMIFKTRQRGTALPKPLIKAGLAWTFFSVAAAISLRHLANPLGGSKELVDAFVLPALLGWYVIREFPLRRWMPALHVVICLMSLYVACIGVAEFITGQDLLELPSSVFIVVETGDLQRVNGPFGTNNSFGLIGLISLLLLVFLRRALDRPLTGGRYVMHLAGIVSAGAITLLPMFRSIVMSAVIILALELYLNKKASGRVASVLVVLSGIAGFYSLQHIAPEFFKARVSDPSDLYARIAQTRQTWDLFLTHPFNGVGLGNYPDAALALPDASYHGVDSVGSAHNTLGAIFADTGLSGFVPFVVAQMFLFQAFWKLRKRATPQAVLASTFFLYVFIAYWVTGLMLTSGYYSDLNLWYLFAIGLLYKFAWTESESMPAMASRHMARSFAPTALKTAII